MTTGSSDGPYDSDLALGLALADLADSATLARFQAIDLRVETKPDLTPVSDADTTVERILREHLQVERPDDHVHGEEYGGEPVMVGRTWVLDPIDGTKNFVRGVPVWATLIALLVDGHPVVGVVSAPSLGRRWWAGQGTGAWSSAPGGSVRRLAVSAVSRLEDASVSYSSLGGWGPRRAGFDRLLSTAWRTRAYGDFWSHVLVAEGAVDVAAEPELKLWDVAAFVPVVEEAGGRVTGCDGGPATGGAGAVTSNGALHDEVVDLLTAAADGGSR